MATFNELIYILKDIPRQGNGESRSNNYTDRQLAFIINYYRAKIISQQSSKGKEIDSAYVQTLGKVELVKASKSECCLIDCDINDVVLRTVEKIPNFISSKGNSIVSYIGTIDGGYRFTKTFFNKIEFDKYAIITSKRTKYYEVGGYIYITNPPTSNFRYMLVQGVFEAPEAANEFHICGCTTTNCDEGFNFDYPIEISDIDTILKMTIDSEYRFANILPKDTLNDSRDAN